MFTGHSSIPALLPCFDGNKRFRCQWSAPVRENPWRIMILSCYHSGKLRFFGRFQIGPKPEILPVLLHTVGQSQVAEPVVYPLGAHFRQPLWMALIKPVCKGCSAGGKCLSAVAGKTKIMGVRLTAHSPQNNSSVQFFQRKSHHYFRGGLTFSAVSILAEIGPQSEP